MGLQATAIGSLYEVLLNVNTVDKVDVDAVGNIQYYLFYEKRAVIFHNIQPSQETECLAHKWCERQLDASVALDGEGVGQVILVEVGAYVRQWTHKTVGQECHIVLKDVNFFEPIVHHVFYARLGIKLFIET